LAGFEGHLRAGSIFHKAGIDPGEVLPVRHALKKNGLTGPDSLAHAKVMAYVAEQEGEESPSEESWKLTFSKPFGVSWERGYDGYVGKARTEREGCAQL
jgi:hypothetical protein